MDLGVGVGTERNTVTEGNDGGQPEKKGFLLSTCKDLVMSVCTRVHAAAQHERNRLEPPRCALCREDDVPATVSGSTATLAPATEVSPLGSHCEFMALVTLKRSKKKDVFGMEGGRE